MRAAWASVVMAAAAAFAGACGTGDSSPAPTASVATPQPATATGAVPTETATTVPSPSVTPPPAASVPLPAAPFDDATGPVAMLVSYYDAVNRHDFARAYAYLRNPAVGEPAFAAGYAGTVLAVPILRPASGIDAAAGNRAGASAGGRHRLTSSPGAASRHCSVPPWLWATKRHR